MSGPLLDVRDLRTYIQTDAGTVKAVDGLSFQLERGQTLGLVGESGSGKSVTSLSLLRLLPEPQTYYPRGQIFFNGRDILKLASDELRALRGNRIAMIFQDPMTSLNPFLSIGRQLSEVLELHKKLSGKKAMAKCQELLERVGISDAAARLQSYPHQLSGGQRQRVMIAMALLCEPDLLIADEPTTALDVTVQAQILSLLRDLQRDFGTGLILISHDLAVVSNYAKHIAVMYAGRIVEYGDCKELLRQPRHPYTRALIKSRPQLDAGTTDRLTVIPGLPPDLSRVPAGCAFAPRCEMAQARCSEYPPFAQISNGHKAACWFAQSK